MSIGPFFCINNQIIAHCIPLADAEPYGACKTTSVSHLDFWDASLAVRFPAHEYEDFPRGRVVYRQGAYWIYFDRCLDTLPAIEAICAAFCIPGNWATFYDEHYQCPACRARANGAIVFDSAVRKTFRSPDALCMLHKPQYPAFGAALKNAFNQICKPHKGLDMRVGDAGDIQVTWKETGEEVTCGLSYAEEHAAELAYKAALAEVMEQPLALFFSAEWLDEEAAQRARAFIEGIPEERKILSEPFQ